MLYNTLHNRWLRIVAAVVGELIAAAALNLFIVPLNLYTGGIMGVCQLIRTFLQTLLGVTFGAYDIAGILYFLVNVPILLFAYKSLGLGLVAKTIICTVSYSLFYSIIPIPSAPIVDDYLTACLLGGILTGIGSGIVLTCGCSSGGLDVIGLCLSKRGSSFTVGKFSLTFNVFLYTACLILFSPEVAIYSVIYNFFASMVLDRMHQQNVNVMALIFTHADEHILGQFIIDKLNRGVTYWNGTGAYTGQGVHVLCVSLSKYEIEELLHAVRSIDPQAFLTVQEGVHVYGNFRKKLE
ncbi:YitT family protein [Oscillibacter valericigenes]|uniref:YitT family protein n=1 Tax=Oscillibacter valericigenes TaxID=351091 RepID=UPI001F17E2FF|nr:YitT family protein [Oscillibacter valericigenes]MCF2616144.1 YitT family protein [Oscillibacter valericigenes]